MYDDVVGFPDGCDVGSIYVDDCTRLTVVKSFEEVSTAFIIPFLMRNIADDGDRGPPKGALPVDPVVGGDEGLTVGGLGTELPGPFGIIIFAVGGDEGLTVGGLGIGAPGTGIE